MTFFSPLAGSILQSGQVQRQLSADKMGQVRKAQNQQKNSAIGGEQPDHQVESPDTLVDISDQSTSQQQQHEEQPQKKKQDQPVEAAETDPTHLDLTA